MSEKQSLPLHVVLAALNSQYVHSALAPWWLKAGVKAFSRLPHQVKVIEGTVNEPLDRLRDRLVAAQPEVLGLSCYIWNIRVIKALLPKIREALPGCLILLGGPEVSFCAEAVMRECPQVDFLIAGEGEIPLAGLLDALAGEGALRQVPGLCFREGDQLHISPAHCHPGIPPSPYCPEYFEALQSRIAYIEASRGCPYACAFCLSGRSEDRVRFVPLPRVFEEIAALAQAGTQTIKFVDRTFNAHREQANAILSHLAENADRFPPGLTFHFEIAGDILHDATLKIIENAPAGLFQFEIGLQSMDEGVLSKVRRQTDMKRLRANVKRLLSSRRAHVHLDLIAGLTGEDLPTFIQGFNQAYLLSPQALQLGFLKIIHGSAMREQPENYPCVFDPLPPYTVTRTPWMSGEDLDALRLAERALDKLHNSGRFYSTLRFLTRVRNIAPFTLFHRLGEVIRQAEQGGQSLPLDQLTCLVLEHLTAWLPGDAPRLFDLMLLDRLASVKSSVLPPCLKRQDPRFFEAKRHLAARFSRPPGTARAMGFLRQRNQNLIAFCDYDQPHPVTGRYRVRVTRLP